MAPIIDAERDAIIDVAIDAQLTNTPSWARWMMDPDGFAEWMRSRYPTTDPSIRQLCREDITLILDAVGYWETLEKARNLDRLRLCFDGHAF